MCNCATMVRIPGETGPVTSYHRDDCPDMRHFWFYYEEGFDAWIPATECLDGVIGEAKWSQDCEIQFKVVRMTQDEFDSLPEGE